MKDHAHSFPVQRPYINIAGTSTTAGDRAQDIRRYPVNLVLSFRAPRIRRHGRKYVLAKLIGCSRRNGRKEMRLSYTSDSEGLPRMQ
jgi:hypothetical protein